MKKIMNKSLVVLSIASLFGMQAYAQTVMEPANNTNMVQQKDIPDTRGLNKKVIKENERTQKDLSKDKISQGQAATLDKNESKIAQDVNKARADGDVTRDEKKNINKQVDRNQDMRDDMKDAHKDAKKHSDVRKDLKTDKVMPRDNPPVVPAR